MTYKESIEFLSSLIDFERWIYRNYEFKLDNYIDFLRKLGEPNERLKRVVLVAGTKGKGSTATMLSRILQGHGERVGLYTSPHLRDYTERIDVSGRKIPEKKFAEIVKQLKPAILSHEPRITFFEAITTAAFYYFLEEETTVNVIEIGLGGRLDATNVTDPELSVITRIGYDHTQTLGSTLTKITAEKCGVLRAGRHVIVGPQRPRVASEISRIIHKIKAKGIRWGKDYSAELVSESHERLEGYYKGLGFETEFMLPVLGTHQIENAAAAIAASLVLCMDLSTNTVKQAFRSIKLPSRIEVIRKRPTIIVDMSHNPESAATLAKTLSIHFSNHSRRLLLIGITRHKNKSAILKTIAPFFTEIYVTDAGFARAEPRAKLLKVCTRYHPRCIQTPSVKQGLETIIPGLSTDDLLVVSGSVYVAGEALEVLESGKRTEIR
ncbi:bifunctional folylpolyglutamate synthase/dihydrofolate synthase [candidate division WOR-3 bacterium]|nr:bifunctional folylpolyglutamate synthase/dihydrofolate synthase [candidate division WOR-3 bacterium]